MKPLILRIITAFSALRAGKVFAADNISVIASCREDADIITGALKVLKDDKRLIVSASGKAEKSVNLILGSVG